jgi:predicted porin
MKKSLFAIAAVTAFAGAAQAQSSVTVYGILDVGFQGVSTRGPLSSTQANQSNTNITRFSGEGAQSTSRLGFRGNEDLGGGTSAFFTAEFGLNPTDATLSGNTGNGLFNRQTFVGLAQKGIGRAAIGTQVTPVHMAVGRTDPGQQNNMVGSVIYTTNASQGSGQTATSYTVRYNNSLSFMTDRMAGFQVNGIYVNNNANSNTSAEVGAASVVRTGPSTATAATTNYSQTINSAWGLGANYVWKKLNVDAAYQTSKNTAYTNGAQSAAAGPATLQATGINFPSNVLGTSLGMTQVYAGAVYDFGILKAYASYISAKYESNLNSNIYLNRAGQQIGVRGNVTPKVEVWASGGNGSYKAGALNSFTATTNATQNFTAYQVGANYILSKRTNLYGIFGATQVSSSSVNISEGASSYGVGVRHTF